MKQKMLFSAVALILSLIAFGVSWAQCPEDPNDLGICDTFYVEPWAHTDTCYNGDCVHYKINTPGSPFPCFLYVSLFVTHDSNTFYWGGGGKWVQDSISTFIVPFTFWHKKAGVGDNVIFPKRLAAPDTGLNNSRLDPTNANFSRSIFRHIVDEHGDSIYNRLAQMVGNDLPAWTVNKDIDTLSTGADSGHVFISLVPLSSDCQRWQEGSRVLLATYTFKVSDSMHVYLDSTFWPPASRFKFIRYDSPNYVPRHDLPLTIWVGPPRIELTSPVGGEVWFVGETQSITWFSENFTGPNVKLEFSTNAGVGWMPIINSTPNDGVHPWHIPDTLSTQCRVRVSDADDGIPSDVSDSNFTISVPLNITVTSPNGGDSLAIGSSKNITWTSAGTIDSVKIELTRDGSTWDTLVAKTPNNGSWTWSPVTGPPSAICKVKISNAAGGVPADTSNNNYTIYQEAITVTSPNGGESWVTGSSHNITWTWAGSFDSVKIELTRDGSTWDPLVAKTPNNGSWTWTPVTGPPSNTCKVKICDKDGAPCDTSDGNFTIFQRNFTILATPETLWVTRGDSNAYTVHLDSIHGFSSPCTLSVAGLPTGAKGKFVPSIVTPPGSSILAINTYADSITAGEYKPVITGKSGGLIHSDTVTFIVDPCTTTTHFLFAKTDSSFIIILDSAFLYQKGLEDCDEIGVFDSNLCVGALVYNSAKAPLALSAWKNNPPDTGYIEGHLMHFKIWSKEKDQEEDARPHFLEGDSTFGPPGDTSVAWLEAPPLDFSIHVRPDTLRVPRGYSGDYKVILTRINNFASNCTLTVVGHPAGSTATFEHPVLVPTDSSVLTLAIPANAVLDTLTLTITAKEMGKGEGITHSKYVTLIITLPTWMFEVKASPDTQTIPQGDSTTYDVTIKPTLGFSASCTLFVQFGGGLPSGVTANFDSNPIPPNDTSTLTITTQLSTPYGEYDLAIIAVANKKQKDTTHVKLIIEQATNVDEEGDQPNAPEKFALFQNRPNPFNPETEISYYLPEGCEVKLTIYNILGRRVKTLSEGYQDAGMKTLVWDGKDDHGGQLSSGIYFYRLQAGTFSQTRKMNLIK